MSRTIRRKSETHEYSWVLRDWDTFFNTYGICYGTRITYDPKSKYGKKALAEFHSDAGTFEGKEPGPSWFRNLTTERPQRREAKRQLHKFMLDEEFEVMLNPMDHLEYWT